MKRTGQVVLITLALVILMGVIAVPAVLAHSGVHTMKTGNLYQGEESRESASHYISVGQGVYIQFAWSTSSIPVQVGLYRPSDGYHLYVTESDGSVACTFYPTSGHYQVYVKNVGTGTITWGSGTYVIP